MNMQTAQDGVFVGGLGPVKIGSTFHSQPSKHLGKIRSELRLSHTEIRPNSACVAPAVMPETIPSTIEMLSRDYCELLTCCSMFALKPYAYNTNAV